MLIEKLRDRDSNPNKLVQSQLCYRYTIPEERSALKLALGMNLRRLRRRLSMVKRDLDRVGIWAASLL